MAKGTRVTLKIKLDKDGKVDVAIKSMEKGMDGVTKATDRTTKSMKRMNNASATLNQWGKRMIQTAGAYGLVNNYW